MIIGKELLICSVSGGKDSTALYRLMVDYYGNDFLPLFADTGNEHPVTVNYVKNLHLLAGGPEVVIVSADFTEKLAPKNILPSGNPFEDMLMWKGRAPSPKAQFCTEWVKLWPQLLYLEQNYPFHDWKMFTGIRAAESKRRQTLLPGGPFRTNSYFDCDYILPLLYEPLESILNYLESKDVPMNPLYALGFSRVGCFPCIHTNKEELFLLPDWAWEKLEHWENRLGRSWFPSGLLPNGWPHIPSINDVRNWCKTSRGGKNYDLFKQDKVADAPSCMSTWGICE
jgi:3'-phosphoadenosine 5'-phosphosulfate sulfotransferase (PAPS reductase)/FAD synthetase